MEKLYGVLDRIEDEKAVIIIEELKKEYIINHDELPKNSKIGSWYILKEIEDNIEIIGISDEKTSAQEEKVTSLMDKLTKNKRASKYRRD